MNIGKIARKMNYPEFSEYCRERGFDSITYGDVDFDEYVKAKDRKFEVLSFDRITFGTAYPVVTLESDRGIIILRGAYEAAVIEDFGGFSNNVTVKLYCTCNDFEFPYTMILGHKAKGRGQEPEAAFSVKYNI